MVPTRGNKDRLGSLLSAFLVPRQLIVLGVGILGLLFASAALAPRFAKRGWLHHPLAQSTQGVSEDGTPLSPGGQFWAGTDPLGRDVFSRVLHGARTSLLVGLGAMLIATVIGAMIGVTAGFHGGKMDFFLMRFTEMNMTVPAILLAVALCGVMDGRIFHLHPAALHWHSLDLELKRGWIQLFFVIGFVSWPGMARVLRTQTLALRGREFITAAKALGATNTRIILRHILPNLAPTLIVQAALNTGQAILIEAGLAYLGLGVPPPAPSWGSMINEGQTYFAVAPHLVLIPGCAIVLAVLGANLVAHGLQESLNPQSRH